MGWHRGGDLSWFGGKALCNQIPTYFPDFHRYPRFLKILEWRNAEAPLPCLVFQKKLSSCLAVRSVLAYTDLSIHRIHHLPGHLLGASLDHGDYLGFGFLLPKSFFSMQFNPQHLAAKYKAGCHGHRMLGPAYQLVSSNAGAKKEGNKEKTLPKAACVSCHPGVPRVQAHPEPPGMRVRGGFGKLGALGRCCTQLDPEGTGRLLPAEDWEGCAWMYLVGNQGCCVQIDLVQSLDGSSIRSSMLCPDGFNMGSGMLCLDESGTGSTTLNPSRSNMSPAGSGLGLRMLHPNGSSTGSRMLCPAIFCYRTEDVESCWTWYRIRDAVPRWLQCGIRDTVPIQFALGMMTSWDLGDPCAATPWELKGAW